MAVKLVRAWNRLIDLIRNNPERLESFVFAAHESGHAIARASCLGIATQTWSTMMTDGLSEGSLQPARYHDIVRIVLAGLAGEIVLGVFNIDPAFNLKTATDDDVWKLLELTPYKQDGITVRECLPEWESVSVHLRDCAMVLELHKRPLCEMAIELERWLEFSPWDLQKLWSDYYPEEEPLTCYVDGQLVK